MLSEKDYAKRIRRNMTLYLLLFFFAFGGTFWSVSHSYNSGLVNVLLLPAFLLSLILDLVGLVGMFMIFSNPEQNLKRFLIGPVILTCGVCILFGSVCAGGTLLISFICAGGTPLISFTTHNFSITDYCYLPMLADGFIFSFLPLTYIYASIELSERLRNRRSLFNKLLPALCVGLAIIAFFFNAYLSFFVLGILLDCFAKSKSGINIVKYAKDRIFTKTNATLWGCYIMGSGFLGERVYNYGSNRNFFEILPSRRKQYFIFFLVFFFFALCVSTALGLLCLYVS